MTEVITREQARAIVAKRKPPRLTADEKAARDAAIRADRAAGMKVADVASRHGVTKGTVSKIANAIEDQDDGYMSPAVYSTPTQSAVAAPSVPEPTPVPPTADHAAKAPADAHNTATRTPIAASNDHGMHSGTPEPVRRSHDTTISAARRATTPDDLPPGPECTVFTHSAATRAVWHAARARLGSPWAVLGCVMAATVAATGPHLQLPALVGGPGSLNLLVSLVGEPGSGKGTAEGIAHHMFTITDENDGQIEVPELPLGTGEGIAELFTRRETPGHAPAAPTPDRVVFRMPEVDALAAASSKRESTIMPVLRQVFMGEPLGHTGASQATTRNVPAHSYRVSVVMGVQPRRSGALLADADGGTPQRVLWLPVAYPGAPDITPPAPPIFTIRLPRGTRNGSAPVTIALPEQVEHQIRENRLRRLRGEAVEGLDGHLLLAQEKVSAALALMDGRKTVADADWIAAGAVIDLSTTTRTACEDARRGADQDEDRKAGERAETRRDASERKRMDTVRARTLERLRAADGPVPFRRLSRPLNSNQRRLLPDVLDELMEHGLVTRHETYNGVGEPTAEFCAAPL